MVDHAEQLPALVDHLQAFQLVPVVLTFLERGQLATRDADLVTGEGAGLFAIVEPLELGGQDLAMQAPLTSSACRISPSRRSVQRR